MALYKSFFTVGFLTIFSRLVGFWREILIADKLGASGVTDAIKIAIKLPSLFRRIFAEGAFNASFVPMFAGMIEKPEGREGAISFAEQILSWLTLILCVLVLVVEFLMPYIFQIACRGFDTERLNLTIQFTRITFPFILFISLTAFYSGILNSLERFISVASSPVIGNIFIVVFIMTTSLLQQDIAISFTIAILGCGIVQCVWVLVPCIRSGYGLRFRIPQFSEPVRLFFRKVGPAALGAGVVQVNILIDMMIASYLPQGYISYLDFAERLNQLPLSVIGTAISTVLLPLMSKQISGGHLSESIQTQNDSIEFAMLLTLPSMCGLMIWATPIVGMIYQHGKFTIADTMQTSAALYAFAMGLPAYILIKIFSTTFFSNKDTKTPVQVAVVSVVLNLILNLLLIRSLKHVGLALATAISAWLNVIILSVILRRRGWFKVNEALMSFGVRMLASLALGVPFLFIIRSYLDSLTNYGGWYKGGIICAACFMGIIIFCASSLLTGAVNLARFKKHMTIVPVNASKE